MHSIMGFNAVYCLRVSNCLRAPLKHSLEIWDSYLNIIIIKKFSESSEKKFASFTRPYFPHVTILTKFRLLL